MRELKKSLIFMDVNWTTRSVKNYQPTKIPCLTVPLCVCLKILWFAVFRWFVVLLYRETKEEAIVNYNANSYVT